MLSCKYAVTCLKMKYLLIICIENSILSKIRNKHNIQNKMQTKVLEKYFIIPSKILPQDFFFKKRTKVILDNVNFYGYCLEQFVPSACFYLLI